MACAICEIRRPRRFCPGVRGDICSICCGTEREVTVECPLDCEYLQAARRHERPAPADTSQWPNQDITVPEQFLAEHEELMVFVGKTIAAAALDMPGTVDFDVREAVEGLIRTYRTLQTGMYYESVPSNPLAANIFRVVREAAAEWGQAEKQRIGVSRTRDADVLGVLVFLQRIELERNNGRRRGRSFIDELRGLYVPGTEEPVPPSSSLILP